MAALRALLCAAMFVGIAGCSAISGTETLIAESRMTLEKCVDGVRPPGDCRFIPILLNDHDESELRQAFIAAQRRQIKEEREAKRNGQVTGGVWGFVNYAYRVTFQTGESGAIAWLHVTTDAAWLEGGPQVGNIAFTREESGPLARMLSRL